MKILVTGGREYDDFGTVVAVLDDLPIEQLAHGGARGADALADRYAKEHGIPVHSFPADWRGPCRVTCNIGHRRRGMCPAAGVYRNSDMLVAFAPDLVVAFPGGRGTADMVRKAREAGVAVLEVAAS